MALKKLISKKKRGGDVANKEKVAFLLLLLNGTLFIFFLIALLVVYSALDSVSGEPFFTLYDIPKASFIMTFLLLQIGLYLVYSAFTKLERDSFVNFIRVNSGVKILFLLLFLLAISTLNAAVASTAVSVLLQWLILGGAFIVWVQLFARLPGRWSAVYGLITALIIFNMIGIAQFFGLKIYFLLPILGPASTLGYRNPAAHFQALVIPFVLFAAWHCWRLWRTSGRKYCFYGVIVLSGVAASSIILIFMNFSRTAILALIIEVMVLPFFWLFTRSSGKKNWPIGRIMAVITISLSLVVILIYVFPKSRQRIYRSWEKFQQSPAELLEFRYYHWGNTSIMIKDNPIFGVGIGNWRIIYPLYYKSFARDPLFNYHVQIRRVHNDYLQLAAECGIPALLIFLLLWGRQFYLLRFATLDHDDEEDWRLPLLASLLAFSVIMFFSFPMQMAYSRMFCFFLLALGEARAWPALSK